MVLLVTYFFTNIFLRLIDLLGQIDVIKDEEKLQKPEYKALGPPKHRSQVFLCATELTCHCVMLLSNSKIRYTLGTIIHTFCFALGRLLTR